VHFDQVFPALKTGTRAGKYIQNCFLEDKVELTGTGRKMKRYLARNHRALGVGSRPLFDFLLDTDDATLKRLFGRKFLNVRTKKRLLTGYNLFISEHGFGGAAQAWNVMDAGDKEHYNNMAKHAPSSKDKKRSKKVNTWTMAIKEWNRRQEDARDFAPIKIGTTTYTEIKSIQEEIKKGLTID